MSAKTVSGAPNELFEQAMEMFEVAMQTGLKIQEESTRRLSEMLARFGPAKEWQKKTQAMFNDAIQTTQTNVEEAMRVLNESAKRNLDVWQKTLDAGQADAASDGPAKVRDVWETAVGAVQANAQAIVQANTRILESWAELAKKFHGVVQNGNQ